MQTLVLVIHVLAAAGIVVLVLLQHGKGADMGAAFGSGSAGSLFGSAGAANFLSRTTAILAALFIFTSLGLGILATRGHSDELSLMGSPAASTAPLKPGASSSVTPPATPSDGKAAPAAPMQAAPEKPVNPTVPRPQ